MGVNQRFEEALKLLEEGEYLSAQLNFHELAGEAEDREAKITYTNGELLALVRLGRTAEARKLLHASKGLFQDIGEAQLRADLIEVQINSVEDKWEQVLPSLDRMMREYDDILHHPQLRDVYEEIQLRRGMRLAFLGQLRQALPILVEVLNFNPSLLSGEFYFELARCYTHIQDRESAREAFTKALDKGLDDVRSESARWELAVFLMRKGDYERALEELRLAEKHADGAHISKANTHKALAVCLHELGMEEQARHYARLAGVTK